MIKTPNNPLIGREQDIILMFKNFLYADQVKDQPAVYHKKLALLTTSVAFLKHLYGDEVSVEYLISFFIDKEVRENDFRAFASHIETERENVEWLKHHLTSQAGEDEVIVRLLAQELWKFPH